MIEEKIARLPPELQREVEDFIDYLLKRYKDHSQKHGCPETEIAPVILAQECDSFEQDDPSSPTLPEFNVLDAAGGWNGVVDKERTIRDILDWIE